MILNDHKVIKVLGPPYKQNEYWYVDIKAQNFSKESNHSLLFFDRQTAEKVKIGFVFLA